MKITTYNPHGWLLPGPLPFRKKTDYPLWGQPRYEIKWSGDASVVAKSNDLRFLGIGFTAGGQQILRRAEALLRMTIHKKEFCTAHLKVRPFKPTAAEGAPLQTDSGRRCAPSNRQRQKVRSFENGQGLNVRP
jgi:hypothetical protein